MTLLEVLKRATVFLEAHGSGSPRLDADLLLAHALGLRRLDLYLQFEKPMAESELGPYRDLVARRGKGEPVAYLTGHKEFMKLDFKVTPAVLLPNPDTEVLVQRAVEWGRARGGPIRVADVGTGSGCIALSLAHYLGEATVLATDIDAAALAVAQENAGRLGLEERVHFCQQDLLGAGAAEFDLICANLPYLADGLVLAAEVTAQPAHALRGGPVGHELTARLLTEAPIRLKPGGAVICEIDPPLVAHLAPAPGFAGWRVHRDLGGYDRVLECWT